MAVLIEFKGGVNAPWIAKQTARLFSNLDFNSLARAATDPNGVVLGRCEHEGILQQFLYPFRGLDHVRRDRLRRRKRRRDAPARYDGRACRRREGE